MTNRLVADASRAAFSVRDARHLRSFRRAVADFVDLLATVPDERAGALTADGVRALQTLGEDVIDRIEERVADIDKASDAQELVAAVYEIRRLLEQATMWQQHYAIARPV